VLAGVRDPIDGEKLLVEAGDRIHPVPLDITDGTHLRELARRLPERLDAVVNNAGIGVGGPVEGVDLDDVRRVSEVNVLGQIAVTQAVLPRLRAGRGRVVFVSSSSGRVAAPLSAPYNASKFALEGLADALRLELRPWRIPVVLVEPGVTDTDIWRTMPQTVDVAEHGLTPELRDLYGEHFRAMRKSVAFVQAHTMPVDKVAATVQRAVTARRPRPRYVVGIDARAQIALRAILPTRAGDAAIARMVGLK
jgi:NAD(P)-dependent dehydrogenase (short-subunit alcohol dehydrogenase family)